MNYFLCLWHYVAMFFVSQSFISSPPNPLHSFLSSWTSLWTFFGWFILILSAIYFLLKVHLPKICEIKPFSYRIPPIYLSYTGDRKTRHGTVLSNENAYRIHSHQTQWEDCGCVPTRCKIFAETLTASSRSRSPWVGSSSPKQSSPWDRHSSASSTPAARSPREAPPGKVSPPRHGCGWGCRQGRDWTVALP